MESKINAQTEKKTGERQEPDCEDDRRGVELLGKSRAIFRLRKQNGITSRYRRRSNFSRSSRSSERKVHLGKILKRVELLEQQYLEYTGAHQDRLETRLEESRQKVQAFLQLAQELKQDLLDALADEDEETETEES